ncbi:O-antigen ligase family protein [Vibrio sp.]|uniref:O-antigen ligase family protein n=1 Tax=Vibrio sp. TaxID=678 RepID=UPI003D0D1860
MNRFDGLVIACLSLYLIGAIPVAIVDGTTLRYFQGGIRALLSIPIYLLFVEIFQDRQFPFAKYLAMGTIIGSVGAVTIAIYQYFILGMPRVDGFLFSINFGYLASALTFLAFCLVRFGHYKTWLYLATVLSAIATVLTITRGAILAIPLLLIFAALLNGKALRIKTVMTGSVVLVLAAVLSYQLIPAVKARADFTANEFTNIARGDIASAESSGGRLQLWKVAIETFQQKPFTGMPYPQREELVRTMYQNGEVTEWVTTVGRAHAHSQYFEMLASNGVWGVVSIIFMLLVPLAVFIRHYQQTNSDWAYTGAVFVAGFCIYGLTEAPLQANLIGCFYGFMLALFFAQVRTEKYNSQQTNT